MFLVPVLGTWGRTPEQLYFFEEAGIEKYSALQKKIVSNVIPQLKPWWIICLYYLLSI
jgi:16S rRNA C967 or C1407 C5-methylase (RsmB/RsmF family)